MQISEHYRDYPKETVIVVSNNELAKILIAHNREIEEVSILTMKSETPSKRASGTPNSAPPDLDSIKARARQELYKELSDELASHPNDPIVLCAPEANKNEIVECMHPDVMKRVTEVVPKNLASLPLDQVVRILQETRGE